MSRVFVLDKILGCLSGNVRMDIRRVCLTYRKNEVFCDFELAVALFILFFAALFAFSASATSHVAQFVFITEPRTAKPNEISEEIIIQAQDESGNPVSPGETLDLEFISSSPTGEFLNSSGEPVSKVWNSNWKNRTFYYRDSVEGTHTLLLKATGRTSRKTWEASQKITVSGENSAAPSSQPSDYIAGGRHANGAPPAENSVQASIQAYAGEDRAVAVGSEINFLGHATGLDGKPLDTARFWWNFGDGESKEGRSVGHIFMIPGEYTVGLHVSSGEYAASDYLKVQVIPNQISVSSVLVGEKGYLKIKNPSSIEIEIGGWIIEDGADKRFTVPPKTRIGSGAEVAFVNQTTGLLYSGPARIVIYYPNLTKALEWKNSSATPQAPQVALQNGSSEGVSHSKNEGFKGIDASSSSPRKAGNSDFSSAPPPQNEDSISARSEFAQASESSPSPQFFFWTAFAISTLAAAGFIISKRFIA